MKIYFVGTILEHKFSYTRINLLFAALVVVATLSGGLVWGVQAHKNDQPVITTVKAQSTPSLAMLWQRPRQPAFSEMFTPALPASFMPGENGAVCVPPGTVYVNGNWLGTTPGTDPDGFGPATDFGCDSFATIHEGVTGVTASGMVLVAAGNYAESQIVITKGITIQGAGAAVTTVDGGNFVIVSAAGSGPGTIFINQTDASSPVKIDGFTFVNPSIWVDNDNQVTSIGTLGVLAPVTISHNHFIGVATATSDLFDNAIWMYLSAGGGVANITDNEFEHSWQSVFLEVPVPGAVITGNSFHDLFATGAFPSQAMSLWTYGGQDVTAPVTITTNTFASSAGWSIVLRGGGAPLTTGGTENAQFLNDVTITGNLVNTDGAGIVLRNPASNVSDPISGTDQSGIVGATISGNTITSITPATGTGIWLRGPNNNTTVTSNSVRGFASGILSEPYNAPATSTGAAAQVNAIVGNTNGISNQGATTIDGQNNWWGCNAGPGMAGCDSVTGVVDFDPWIQLLASAALSALNPGGSSTITADMTHNSDGVDTSGSGTIPSTPVAFTATEGTMSPTAGSTTAGQATSTFTSTSGNNGSACATVDNQETCTPIGVTAPSFAVDDVAHLEGDAGTTSFTFTVTKSGATDLNSSVNFITQDGSATIANADYQTDTGTLNFGPTDTTMQFTVMVNGDLSNEPAELFMVTLSSAVNATISRGDGGGLVQNDDGPTAAEGTISGQILDGSGTAVEGVTIQVEGTQTRRTITDREGKYQIDGVHGGGFYTVTPSRANFTFNPGQRSFSQLGDHTDAAFTATTTGGALNPLDTSEYFVRQQYLDFLGREPDEAGFNFWVNNIAACGGDSSCLAAKRSDTSAAFFLSIEFQQTGYLVYRIYQSAYGNRPVAPIPLTLAEFNPDTAAISNGVVVNAEGWEAKLETNKQAFAAAFVARPRFTSAYPIAMTPGDFVDRLFTSAGVTPDLGDRSEAVSQFAGATDTVDAPARVRALRLVAENATLRQQDFDQAFVLMQYFGYLGRDPNAGPDGDFSGYNFWLSKLDSFGGDFRRAEMVQAFLVAGEYRGRFPR